MSALGLPREPPFSCLRLLSLASHMSGAPVWGCCSPLTCICGCDLVADRRTATKDAAAACAWKGSSRSRNGRVPLCLKQRRLQPDRTSASLSLIRQPVTGPVFRVLTWGRRLRLLSPRPARGTRNASSTWDSPKARRACPRGVRGQDGPHAPRGPSVRTFGSYADSPASSPGSLRSSYIAITG